MRSYIFLLCVLTAVGANGQAGQTAVPKQLRSQMTMDRITDLNGIGRTDMLYGVPSEPGRVLGDYYLDGKWNNGTIMLNGTETLIEGYPLKYDLKTHTVEIKVANTIKLLDAKKVKSVVWVDSLKRTPQYFVNASAYTEDGTPLQGLIEVVEDGAMPLFCRSTIWVKKSNYVAAFDVGSKDEVINKRKTYYYVKDKELVKITSKKKLLPAFGEMAPSVDEFIKINSLGTNKAEDLQRIFAFVNSKKS